ncbi:hypothetical protein B0H16DRAFT_1846525 [Mycena metata]|uniref:Uncharacterized protein n=1 Tax=Mycena metata TaxID=1033252 RepID=A0AAD7NWX0_9AGAR|nr:hypothetical protein B0H16DRAFT_1846525 [Mycena metata]
MRLCCFSATFGLMFDFDSSSHQSYLPPRCCLSFRFGEYSFCDGRACTKISKRLVLFITKSRQSLITRHAHRVQELILLALPLTGTTEGNLLSFSLLLAQPILAIHPFIELHDNALPSRVPPPAQGVCRCPVRSHGAPTLFLPTLRLPTHPDAPSTGRAIKTIQHHDARAAENKFNGRLPQGTTPAESGSGRLLEGRNAPHAAGPGHTGGPRVMFPALCRAALWKGLIRAATIARLFVATGAQVLTRRR